MTRGTLFAHPLLLGFEGLEKLLERVDRLSNEGYPPFNIEQVDAESPSRLRITLAVAGFAREDLTVSVDGNELIVRGKQAEHETRAYLHRGIAARQFVRVFVLADGMRVTGAALENGLLSIELERPEPQRVVQNIEIAAPAATAGVRRRTAV